MKQALTNQKLRGGYYTPPEISKFITDWAVISKEDRILEPSCGDGSFIEATINTLLDLKQKKTRIAQQVFGVELDEIESTKAKDKMKKLINSKNDNIITGDFFVNFLDKFSKEEKFDVVVGNPPFIRYQNFPESQSYPAFKIMRDAGLNPNKLTNIWTPFLVASSLLLKDNGRLGMVIPAELFQVKYAEETRKFLSEYFESIIIITFKNLVFDDIQQEIILLLCERKSSKYRGIKTIEIKDINELKNFKIENLEPSEFVPLNHSKEKWLHYFLDKEEIFLLRKIKSHPSLTLSKKILDVDVGVVTGLNDFFVLSSEQVVSHSLQNFTSKIVTKSNHLKGLIFSEKDWIENVENNHKTYLLHFPEVDFKDLPSAPKKYVSEGEKKQFNTGYKCRIRKRWFIVPSVWVPEAFMLRQVHSYPKIIINNANATCTDTVHRVKFLNGISPKIGSLAFLNSLTFAFSEVTGRSYGGGVMTFEPSEMEDLPIPLKGAEKLDLDELDELLRKNDIESVLDITDKVLLIDGLGLKKEEVNALRSIWVKLRNRRINRKHSKKEIIYDSKKQTGNISIKRVGIISGSI